MTQAGRAGAEAGTAGAEAGTAGAEAGRAGAEAGAGKAPVARTRNSGSFALAPSTQPAPG